MRSFLRLSACLVAILALTGPATAMEHWGRVKSVDTRFGIIKLVQDGNNRTYQIRPYAETIFVMLDGTTMQGIDIRQLEGKRIYAIVEENPEAYVTKLWIRKDVPPERDPVNPGVGASRR